MRTHPDISKKLAYPIPEFCAAASIGRTSVYNEIASGRLNTVKVGRRRVTHSSYTTLPDTTPPPQPMLA